ncbi:hypothetical protein POPTR_009G135600v4 [Populus trichocarpa]|uniref:Uncharacterized protein n=2 Tax=Populus trichocarpa TaxID=3694 RepID=B9HR51_POPTR|nr:chloroplast protein FOR GROWTH AND FERTILITY 2 [Populus trichocarpa]PNT21220.1 hypothetical protein POPTR_009G135600v4 [Populus trichocarpa]|eukprot:XP_002312957.2 uncharacterized protein LOC7472113 [Populus trichocarpa]
MERLLYSSSPTPLKTHFKKPTPLLPRLCKLELPKPGFPSLTRPEFRRVNSVSCKHENPSNPFIKLPSLSPLKVDSSSGSTPKSHLVKQIVDGVSVKSKAATVGIFMVVSALIMLIHPVFALPAFATFQTAAQTGGPAAAAGGAKFMRTELLTSAWAGLFAGCLHTLSGPDHLAALAPLSIGRSRMESAAVGALWGCGHDAGQVIFGLLFLLLKDRLHIEIIRTWGTRVVGLTLLVIGAMGIKEASEVPTPCVALENGECDVSAYEALETPTVGKKKKIGFATFATGIVHGLQPDALMMVLPALALPSRVAGAAFLIMFLFGTVVAMGSYTVFIGSCSEALKDRVPRITEKLTWVSSLIAIALGLGIIVSQLFGFSLY